MIERLTKRNINDVYEFIKRVSDRYNDFYITEDKQRKFLDNFELIRKVLVNQEVYGLFDKELKGILMIYKEKGFRTYLKLLTDNRNTENSLLRYFMWNCVSQDLFLKLKKSNPLSKYIQNFGFVFSGDRGEEVLLFRKGTRKFILNNFKDNKEIGE